MKCHQRQRLNEISSFQLKEEAKTQINLGIRQSKT